MATTPSRQSKRQRMQPLVDMTVAMIDPPNEEGRGGDRALPSPHAAPRAQQRTASNAFVVVRLSGVVFPDDRGALRDIARQLDVTPDGRGFSSFAECLSHLLKLFAAGQTDQTRPILFVLDEFDAFAQRPKQTLLYNLFDLAQSGRAPVAVIGLTCRMDVVDTLEKRVKSRFSHRIVHLRLPNTFDDYMAVAGDALAVEADRLPGVQADYHLLADSAFVDIAKRFFALTKDIRSIFRICQPLLSSDALASITDARQRDLKMQLLQGVSVLDLCLMIAAKRLLDTAHVQINFAMIFDEYLQLFASTATGGMKHYKREVALKAFERLMELELILPTEHQKSLPKEYRMTKLALHPYQVEEAVKQYKNCPEHLLRWVSLSATS
ncbi:origin recognition complex subunit 4 C-terminus-domain-containing protein [Syncephalis pseudoplumigaleata]|uniref:Origin recognition complex subunit 4 n=1 Tax=Syncephalis pseudoplumigaleata TaxID=1712513 RepID=A0A4P9Z4M9_9FUNG|nr:origin recognition complex subunit 4 C-terminus-domain-containing protein [Syncephalis pseudoplumigaleata]|eukprot:RKP26801.1 origin recognition complex subunit 4 C-terminus-domain-containing protein [Syncephalis pseudoplumigaleata]